jgi:hypothetical protein
MLRRHESDRDKLLDRPQGLRGSIGRKGFRSRDGEEGSQTRIGFSSTQGRLLKDEAAAGIEIPQDPLLHLATVPLTGNALALVCSNRGYERKGNRQ